MSAIAKVVEMHKLQSNLQQSRIYIAEEKMLDGLVGFPNEIESLITEWALDETQDAFLKLTEDALTSSDHADIGRRFCKLISIAKENRAQYLDE